MQEGLHRVVLGLGSNCGDKAQNLKSAREYLIGVSDGVFHSSQIYETPDAHGAPEKYFNLVMEMETLLGAETLTRLLKEYEVSAGRTSDARVLGRVPIDIDIVIFDGNIVRPKDFRQSFFQIGYQEISADRTPCEDCLVDSSVEINRVLFPV